MSKINPAPPPREGPHCQLGVLVRREAIAHFYLITGLVESEPELGIRQPTLADVERGIWEALRVGWARPLADWSGMVHANPGVCDPETGKCAFEPWSVALLRVRIGLERSMREVMHAYTGDHSAEVPEANGAYTGKRAVVFDASDRKGHIH